MESDILVNINDVNVRNMCHSEVVQVLKDCERDQEALIYVQRTAGKSQSTLQDKDSLGKGSKEKGPLDFFRSKTPTADIYSTQAKTVVPQRPKTPLIDTRNKSRNSPLPIQNQQQQQQQQEQKQHEQQISVVKQENELQNVLDNGYKYDNQEYAHGIYGYTEMPYKPKVSHISDNFAMMSLSGEQT